jgi:hypothetical protein
MGAAAFEVKASADFTVGLVHRITQFVMVDFRYHIE